VGRSNSRQARHVVAGAAVLGSLVAGALASAAAAAADTAPEVPNPGIPPGVDLLAGGNGSQYVPGAPPAGVDPQANILQGLAQNGTGGGPYAGLPSRPDTSGATPNEYVLAQNSVPQAPGGPAGAPVNLNPLFNQYLLPQYEKPAAPGQGPVRDFAPGEENAVIAPGDYMHRLWGQFQQGDYKGGLLGQMPHEQLAEPLPGTAPPPGTTVPVGEGQNLPDSAWEPPPPAPLPPGAIPPAPPAG
jgi:hypothetical protein